MGKTSEITKSSRSNHGLKCHIWVFEPPGQPVLGFTTLPMGKLSLLSSLNFSWHNLMAFPLVLLFPGSRAPLAAPSSQGVWRAANVTIHP